MFARRGFSAGNVFAALARASAVSAIGIVLWGWLLFLPKAWLQLLAAALGSPVGVLALLGFTVTAWGAFLSVRALFRDIGSVTGRQHSVGRITADRPTGFGPEEKEGTE